MGIFEQKLYFYPNISNTINLIALFLMTKIIWVAMNLYITASYLLLEKITTPFLLILKRIHKEMGHVENWQVFNTKDNNGIPQDSSACIFLTIVYSMYHNKSFHSYHCILFMKKRKEKCSFMQMRSHDPWCH